MKLDEKTRNCLGTGWEWVSNPIPSVLKQQQPNNFYREKMEIVKWKLYWIQYSPICNSPRAFDFHFGALT